MKYELCILDRSVLSERPTIVVSQIVTPYNNRQWHFPTGEYASDMMKQTEAFRLLASADRQLVLHELCKKDGNATVKDLSEQIAVRRHRIDPERITDEKIERAHVRLVHTHFPQLREVGLVDIDWDDGEVAFTDEECVDQLFDAAAELESWPPNELLEHPSRSR